MPKAQLLLTIILALPALSYAASNDLLSQYENMIYQANNQPVTNGTQQSGQKINPGIANGQAALLPTPLPAQPAAPVQNTAPAPFSESDNTNAINNAINQDQSNKQQTTAPAGPPNIFITPGDNTNSKQGGSIIHY